MKAKYDTIGEGYNRTRQADPHLTERLIHHLQPSQTGQYVDIGCGTGNYTHAIQQRGISLIGIDPSARMLAQAKANNPAIDWRMGTAEETGLASDSVDGIMGFLTIHHWTNLEQGFGELSRVLKRNGRIVVFTATPEQMAGYWLNHYFPQMLADSIAQMPALERVTAAMQASGLELLARDPYAIQPDLQDHFLYCGKHDPTLYLDADIRRGISSFSSLANQAEVTQGLAALQQDIESGQIQAVMKAYEHDLGDYLYIVGQPADA